MKFEELPEDQRKDLIIYDAAARGIVSGLCKTAKDGNANILSAFAVTRVTPVVSGLEPDEIIPTECGYSGIQKLKASEMIALQELLDTLNKIYADNIVLTSKCAGVNC